MCVWCTCAREGTTATMKSVTKWSLAYAHSSLYLVHSPNASYWLFGSFSLFLSNPRLDSSRAADCVCVFSFVVIVNHCVALPIWFCMVSMAQLDCIYIEQLQTPQTAIYLVFSCLCPDVEMNRWIQQILFVFFSLRRTSAYACACLDSVNK